MTTHLRYLPLPGTDDDAIVRAQAAAFVALPPFASHSWRLAERNAACQALYDQGCDDVLIADVIGLREVSVFRWRQNCHLPSLPPPPALPDLPVTAAQASACTALYDEGHTDYQIATTLALPWQAVVAWRTRYRLHANPYVEPPFPDIAWGHILTGNKAR